MQIAVGVGWTPWLQCYYVLTKFIFFESPPRAALPPPAPPPRGGRGDLIHLVCSRPPPFSPPPHRHQKGTAGRSSVEAGGGGVSSPSRAWGWPWRSSSGPEHGSPVGGHGASAAQRTMGRRGCVSEVAARVLSRRRGLGAARAKVVLLCSDGQRGRHGAMGPARRTRQEGRGLVIRGRGSGARRRQEQAGRRTAGLRPREASACPDLGPLGPDLDLGRACRYAASLWWRGGVLGREGRRWRLLCNSVAAETLRALFGPGPARDLVCLCCRIWTATAIGGGG